MLKTVGFPSTRTGDQTIVNGNLVIGTAGKGIDFSVNPSAPGMTSELLDDYETGSWTPTLAFGGASTGIVYASPFMGGKYTKIGNRVIATGSIVLSDKGTATGPAVVGGLPFSSGSGFTNVSAVSVAMRNVTFADQFQAVQTPGTATVELLEITMAGGVSSLSNADFANSTELQFLISYIV